MALTFPGAAFLRALPIGSAAQEAVLFHEQRSPVRGPLHQSHLG
jgi:hypothetical protein